MQQFRDQRFQEARDTLESTDFARFIIDMNSWIDSEEWLAQRRPIDQLLFERPIGVFAESRIQKMNQKLLKAGRRAEVGDLEDWHRLRIMTKKVRYASEPLLGIIGGKKGPSFAKSLSKLQDTLGKLNDLNSIETFLAQVSPSPSQMPEAPKAEPPTADGQRCPIGSDNTYTSMEICKKI